MESLKKAALCHSYDEVYTWKAPLTCSLPHRTNLPSKDSGIFVNLTDFLCAHTSLREELSVVKRDVGMEVHTCNLRNWETKAGGG